MGYNIAKSITKQLPRIFVLALALHFHIYAKSQFDYNSHIKYTHKLILDLQFEKAQHFITNNETQNNGLWWWLKAQKCFIENLSRTETNKTDSAIDVINLCIINLSKYKSNNPYFDYSLADLNLYKSYLQLYAENYISALQSFYKAKKYVENLKKNHPEFEASIKQQLIIRAVSSYVKNYFSSTYESESTAQEFSQTFSNTSNQLINRELNIITPIISYALNDTNTINDNSFPWLTDSFYKTGPLETFTYCFIMNKQQKYTSSQNALNYSDSMGFSNRFNYLNLMYGVALLNKMDDKGILKLNAYTANNKSSNGNAYANLKCAWYYFIEQNAVKYNSYISKIDTKKTYPFNIDKQVAEEIKNKNEWVPELIKSRMLFDAGKYDESIHILLQDKVKISSFSEDQKLEYAYRLGRNYQMLNESDKAIRFFKMVIASNMDKKFYYPTYAAYNCGIINEKINNFQLAEFYFKLCLNLDSPIYKSAIHTKAKKALEKLPKQLN